MVIDTSAVLAILQLEPEAESFAQRIDAADVRRISSVSILEAGIVVEARKGRGGAQELDAFLQQGGFVIEPFDADRQRSLATRTVASARGGTKRR